MSNSTRSDAQQSLFVFVRDAITNKVTRLAIPTDTQIGMTDNPAELHLLGRLALATREYNLNRSNRATVQLTGNDTVAAVTIDTSSFLPTTITALLPDGAREGYVQFVKDESGVAGTVPIDIRSSDGSLIDGQNVFQITNNFSAMGFYRRVDGWHKLFATGGSGQPAAGFVEKSIHLSPLTLMLEPGLTPTADATANFSVGGEFGTRVPGLTVTGIQTYWAGGAATIRASLWQSPGVRVAVKDMAVSGPGWYFIPFTTPYVVPMGSTDPTDNTLGYSIFDTGLGQGTRLANAQNVVHGFPKAFANGVQAQLWGGPDIWWNSWSLFAAGDTYVGITNSGLPDAYPVEPVIVRWNNKTALPFAMPAVNASANVTMAASVGLYLRHGITVQVQGAGVMLVSDTSADPVIGLINIGDPFNAPMGTTVAAGSIVN
jgi:hypothetical protein